MKIRSLSPNSVALLQYLLQNVTIANKMKAAGKEGKTYVIYTINSDGSATLGETKYRFWNQLIGCQTTLPFETVATCVWDALVDLSTGSNQEALLQGLSKEVLIKAQREKEYDWVVERLTDCYRHVCNDKGSELTSEGVRGKSGRTASPVITTVDNKPIDLNLHINGMKRSIRFPDSSGTANLVFELGVVGVKVEE